MPHKEPPRIVYHLESLKVYPWVDAEKAVRAEFYAGINGDDVVSKTKVGSPALVIGQHRSAQTLKIRVDNCA